jgi:uncharacterized membrane protein YcaP (DUF421 family)
VQQALDLFLFDLPPWELMLRGSAVYWLLFLLFRFVLRRDAGSLGVADILLLVLIADASQNAMAGGYQTVADGLVLVATIAGWNWLMDWGSYRFPFLRRLTQPPPLMLVRRGQAIRRNMRSEHITLQELMASLREQGVDDLAQVKAAYMEADGQISVIRAAGADDKGESNAAGRPAKTVLP